MTIRARSVEKRYEVIRILKSRGLRAKDFVLGNRGYILAEGIRLIVRYATTPIKSNRCIELDPPEWGSYRFAVLCLGDQFYVVPRESVPPAGKIKVPITKSSKYNKYKNAWNLIIEAISEEKEE